MTCFFCFLFFISFPKKKEKLKKITISFLVLQRPTAKELLKHKFIVKHCKKTSYLSELIDRYRRWKEEDHSDNSSDDSDRYCLLI